MRLICTALLLLLSLNLAQAADDYWTNNAGGVFSTDGNWLDGSAPTSTDNANFTNNASYTLTLSSSVTTSNAIFDAAGGTVTLSIGLGNIWNTTQNFIVGNTSGSSATLQFTSGTNVVNPIAAGWVIGSVGGSTGTVVITGSGTVVSNLSISSSSLSMGSGSSLIIINGGKWFQPNGGYQNIGDVNGTGASLVITNGGGYNGNLLFGGSGSSILVRDSSSYLTNSGELHIGNGISVTMTVTNGATAYAGDIVRLGRSAGSGASVTTNNNLIVTGSGSSLAAPKQIMVGTQAGASNNTLTVANGGSVWTTNLSISVGDSSQWGGGGNNSVTVQDAGSTLAVTNSAGGGAIYVGGTNTSTTGASGTLTINGGTVIADHLYATNGVNGTVAMNYGTLTTKAASTITNTGSLNIGDGVSNMVWNVQGISTVHPVGGKLSIKAGSRVNVSNKLTVKAP